MPKFRHSLLSAVLAAPLALGACAPDQGIDRTTVSTLGGAAAGALIGSQIGEGQGRIAATAAGSLLGALAGREFARQLDTRDQQMALEAERRAASLNAAQTWRNPETGYSGTIQPVRTYQTASGQICREYTHTVYIGGQVERATGTACQQSDGSWRLVS